MIGLGFRVGLSYGLAYLLLLHMNCFTWCYAEVAANLYATAIWRVNCWSFPDHWRGRFICPWICKWFQLPSLSCVLNFKARKSNCRYLVLQIQQDSHPFLKVGPTTLWTKCEGTYLFWPLDCKLWPTLMTWKMSLTSFLQVQCEKSCRRKSQFLLHLGVDCLH